MSQLQEIIKQRISERGRIIFAEFMEMALYEPGLGYYASGKTRVGADGDFYTSPDAHPLFGALIAMQIEQMWQLMGSPGTFTIVEMGAGKGLLARDILDYLTDLSSDFSRALSYVTKEREAISVLKGDQGQVQWPLKGVAGCFLSNELPDAFPVHRVTMQGGQLREVYVTLQGDSFIEVSDEPSTPLLAERLAEQGVTLPEGYLTEVNLGIDPWVAEVAASLERGFVLTIDYGYPSQELYSPARSRGTLVTYYRHDCGSNPYVRVGEQDITAHVDFTAVVRSGEKRGLHCEGLATQRGFLLNLGHGLFVDALARKRLSQRVQMANRMSMLDLVREDGMGAFKVLVQSKGITSSSTLYGLTPDNDLKRALRTNRDNLKVPLLDSEHMPLLQGKYPQYAPGDLEE